MIPVLCRRSLSALPRASTAARAVLCSTTTLPPNVILAEEVREEPTFTPVDFNDPGAFELPVQGFGGGGDAERTVSLSRAVFGVEPSVDLLHDVVRWQRAKKRQGTAHVKNKAEVSGTGKKPWRQKGTGRARAGSLRAPQFRSGGKAHGPRAGRDWSFKMNKKQRRMALMHALAAKHKEGKLWLLDTLDVPSAKTKDFADRLHAHDCGESTLILDDDPSDDALLGSRNLYYCEIMPTRGANVLSILKRETLGITESGLNGLAERLGVDLLDESGTA